MKSKHIFLILLLCILSGFKSLERRSAHETPQYEPSPADTFQVPPANKNSLFYLQRTPNANTVIYDMNIRPDGSLNRNEPVLIYWIRYAEQGQKKDLDFIQRRFAYGIKHEILDKEKSSFILKMVAYDKRPIYLIRSERTKQYKAYMSIQGKMHELSRIYLQIEGGTFWVPNVAYIELTGRDIATGKKVMERFKPQ